ncbi:MAG: VWA domain-containing protein [Acidobacteria bacterium]|nr:VWA domain-containing protein [Acidobacteriota bacterium]
MKKLSLFLSFSVLALLFIFPDKILGQTQRNHVILLDGSASMKSNYQTGLRDWLIAPLLSSGVFQTGDKIILRTFDRRGNKNFIKDDPQRRYQGEFNKENVLSSVPNTDQANGRFTAIAEGLEIAIADIEAYNWAGDTLIWLITDNVQDTGDPGDEPISPFYEKIYTDPNFRNIYFFPIVKEGNSDAVVMYMLDYAKKDNHLQVASLMEMVGKSIGNPAVLFRPIRLSALELDRSNIVLETDDGSTQPVELEDGGILVTLPNGRSLAGRIKFKLRSKFREWRIEQANVSNAIVRMERSDALDIGETETLEWQLDPRTLELGPQETSKKVYIINLASGREISARKVGFLESFFIESEIKVKAKISFEVKDPKLKLAFFDDAELADKIRKVKGLEQIEDFLLPRSISAAERDLALEIPLILKIEQPPKPIWLLVLLAIVLLGAIAGTVVLFTGQTSYKLIGPDGEKIIKLRPIASVPLTISQEQVALLTRRLGTFKVKSFIPYVLEGELTEQKLDQHSSLFTIINSENKRTWNFSLEIIAKQSSDNENDFLV